ncbi:diaminopimelate decarboxylase [Paracoccus sp. SCSIO 75233]|uniref:diaminopimelate decarboxylase n=1 Tax=Paracoccus sp. SCSIO 75233 TaxID=3017782 RepID=UPI0022F0051C|nr:diaminopimelate decarboxylase [Paracoccus sp. SCSIO 75233]WBU53779.1 diaminopimelate decarboxylase [Paracoccus sp. SCSIO 75233]
MDHFNYRDGVLCAEDVALNLIAQEVGTPVFVYSAATLTRHFGLFQQALEWTPDHLICFAVKANSNIAVLKLLGDLGAGMDVVSIGEYARARTAGVPGQRIVFSGVGKTREEMRLALEGGIRQFNVESEPELSALSEVAAGMDAVAPIALRVNPDVDAKTHEKIATGKSENKFGIPLAKAREVYAQAAKLPGIEVVGVDMHIGSQLTDLDPYRQAYAKMADLTRALRADGHDIRRLDMGGGLGIPYRRDNNAPPLPIEYGQVIREAVGDLGCEIEIEPGRNIAGNAGILLASVIYLKEGDGRDFLILDAAMNDLIRPAMYGAHHDIVPVREAATGAEVRPFDVVGPVCETGDTFSKGAELPALSAGDLVAFRSAGAYGAVMASEYNTRPLVPEVLVDGDRFAVIRPRPTLDDILTRESLPDWF